MNKETHLFIELLEKHKRTNTKEELIKIVQEKFVMVKDGRALYHTDFFAVVFCYSKNQSFSNVILSLSKLEKYDHIPCFVVLVKKDLENAVYMINTSFLDKISHSSKDLTTTNIRGSFLGSNIRKFITEIQKENIPANFDDLFSYHQGFTWKENLERLVESTNNIKPYLEKVTLNEKELNNLFAAPQRALKFINSQDYNTLVNELQNKCEEVKEAILVASHIENVNIRGRLIESLITSNPEERCKLLNSLQDIEHLLPTYDTKNDLGDYIKSFKDSDTYTDIKTKILYLNSNPKAYNIDKFLKCMGEDKSVFMFFFIGVDTEGITNTLLCSVFQKELLSKTLLQHHWAGRATRGVAQFNGEGINALLNSTNFNHHIDLSECTKFLKHLLER